MALEVLQWGGFIDGDLPRDSTTSDYVAGQPVEIGANGVKLTITPANYTGVFKNDKSEDDKSTANAGDTAVTSGSGAAGCGVVFGTNKIQMTPGVTAANAGTGTLSAPFVWPGTAHQWAAGDQLYINGSGLWDNQAATGGDPAFGRVTSPPASATGTLQAYMYK